MPRANRYFIPNQIRSDPKEQRRPCLEEMHKSDAHQYQGDGPTEIGQYGAFIGQDRSVDRQLIS